MNFEKINQQEVCQSEKENTNFSDFERLPHDSPDFIIFQDTVLRYLSVKDSEWFCKKYNGKRDNQGYLYLSDGSPSNSFPSQNTSSSLHMKEIAQMTKKVIDLGLENADSLLQERDRRESEIPTENVDDSIEKREPLVDKHDDTVDPKSSPESLERKDIEEMILNAPQLFKSQEKEPPFANYTKNTHESWEYIHPQEIENYLKDRLFFETRDISLDDTEKVFNIYTDSDDPVKIPLDLIVKASGFEDWRGRKKGIGKDWYIKSGKDYLGGTMSSLDVIKLYAGTVGSLPGVDQMNMYVQPDAKIFFDNAGGDSHRIAAAILRGEKITSTRNLCVRYLKKNIL